MKINDSIDDYRLIIVILGVKPDSYGKATRQMKNRALAGVNLLKKHPDSLCIVSGGNTSTSNISEALLLRDILLDNGIKKDMIILEEQSKNTIQNVIYSIEKINQEIGNKYYSVIVCTEKYHSYRAKILFRMNGITIVQEELPRMNTSILLHKKVWLVIRECLALIKDLNLLMYIKFKKHNSGYW